MQRGLRVALNACLRVARADYVVRQDADDFSRKDRLQILYDYVQAHPSLDVVGTAMVSFDETGERGTLHPKWENPCKKNFLYGSVVAHASTIMKKSSIEEFGGYRVSWETIRCEDYDLYMRMYAKGMTLRNIDDGLFSEQTLEALLNVAEKESNYSIVNCNVLCDGSALSFNIGTPYLTLEEQRKNIPSGLIENSACVFNGSLVGREVYDKLGTIRKEYFIRGDEVEFLMRCKNNGVKILTVVESLYYHPRSEYVRLSFFGKKFDYERMPLWKQFFLVRNYVATYCTTANEKQKRTIKRGLELILLGVILHERSLSRLVYLLRAIWEGKKGIFDNRFRGRK